jgi:hypothetical protein
MKKIICVSFFVAITINSIKAQKLPTSQDSIQVFYGELFSVLKKDYLFKDEVNWSEIEKSVQVDLSQYSDFTSSLQEVKTVLDFAKADHSRVYYNNGQFSGTNDGPTAKDFSEQWLEKYATNPEFKVKVLDNQFGYILMPAMSFEDRSKKNMRRQSQTMYDAIHDLKQSENIKGWIIDLRFNTGGDCMPMLLALYDFLGDNDIWGVLDINKYQVEKVKLKNGKYLSNDELVSYIKPKGDLLDKEKVAIITNIATGSSGEITAMAFKGRENTIFIGEKTNGKTTANNIRSLPFGSYMTITTGYDSDRNGDFYEYIVPDIKVYKQDNFDDLLLDGNIKEAVQFINEK